MGEYLSAAPAQKRKLISSPHPFSRVRGAFFGPEEPSPSFIFQRSALRAYPTVQKSKLVLTLPSRNWLKDRGSDWTSLSFQPELLLAATLPSKNLAGVMAWPALWPSRRGGQKHFSSCPQAGKRGKEEEANREINPTMQYWILSW